MNGCVFWKASKISVHNYLALFRRGIEKLEDYGYAESLEIREQIRPDKHLDIKVKAVLVDRSVLHIKEYIDTRYKINRLSYAYHYQNADGGLIFRYDNAMHWDSGNISTRKMVR
ncbi:toxin-antitoxin system TumE family protein [Desulfonema magnum]|uniref:Uncharacterized protein n=1 Tax=Desulfonema magnum TaxID=45655 RepID=A0A975BL62_9BACT|nr:DUF6516 family protein [Desulfonema magnum]QTA87138.1 Uncharacterized protein dnm_031660 [Desulfonema magnum]